MLVKIYNIYISLEKFSIVEGGSTEAVSLIILAKSGEGRQEEGIEGEEKEGSRGQTP